MIKKRGIFYTTAAIALTIVIIITYSAYSSYRLSDKMEVIATRIETVNFFIKDVERDLNNGIYIAGFRSLLSLNQFIANNGTFLDNVNDRFKESFLNGTIRQQPLSLMKDSTFTDWANKISVEANKVDIKFNFIINDVKLNQTDPWNVDIGLNISLDIRDKRNTSNWIKHMNNSYYLAHDDAPNFLMRLQGDMGNSSFGIESLVNLEEFQKQGLAIKDRSAVDYIYFGTKTTTNFRVNNTPEWFKIDGSLPAPGPSTGEHLAAYQVRNITI